MELYRMNIDSASRNSVRYRNGPSGGSVGGYGNWKMARALPPLPIFADTQKAKTRFITSQKSGMRASTSAAYHNPQGQSQSHCQVRAKANNVLKGPYANGSALLSMNSTRNDTSVPSYDITKKNGNNDNNTIAESQFWTINSRLSDEDDDVNESVALLNGIGLDPSLPKPTFVLNDERYATIVKPRFCASETIHANVRTNAERNYDNGSIKAAREELRRRIAAESSAKSVNMYRSSIETSVAKSADYHDRQLIDGRNTTEIDCLPAYQTEPDNTLSPSYLPHDDNDNNNNNVNDTMAADTEVSEALFRAFTLPKNVPNSIPTKFHVLSYIANTNTPLYIRRTGAEFQVTDISGFPLMDVWLRGGCFRPVAWIFEVYGVPVLMFSLERRPLIFGRSFRRKVLKKSSKGQVSKESVDSDPGAEVPLAGVSCACSRRTSLLRGACGTPTARQMQTHCHAEYSNHNSHSCAHRPASDPNANTLCCNNVFTSQRISVTKKEKFYSIDNADTAANLGVLGGRLRSSRAGDTSTLHVRDAVTSATIGYFVLDTNLVQPHLLIQDHDRRTLAGFSTVFETEEKCSNTCKKPHTSHSSTSPDANSLAPQTTLGASPARSTATAAVASSSGEFSSASSKLRVYRCALTRDPSEFEPDLNLADNASAEVGRLEVNESHPSLMQFRFTKPYTSTAPKTNVRRPNGHIYDGSATLGLAHGEAMDSSCPDADPDTNPYSECVPNPANSSYDLTRARESSNHVCQNNEQQNDSKTCLNVPKLSETLEGHEARGRSRPVTHSFPFKMLVLAAAVRLAAALSAPSMVRKATGIRHHAVAAPKAANSAVSKRDCCFIV